MGNCARRLAVGAPEHMTMLGVSTSATPGETSSSHTALEECLPSGHDKGRGDRRGAGSSMDQKSEYFSARVEEMIRSKSRFSSAVEHEIEHSRVHWSEVTGLSEMSEDNDHEEVNRENAEVFAELANDPQWRHPEHGKFFVEWPYDLKLGRKIAEGGQAAIFEVLDRYGNVDTHFVLKVFKRGLRLSDLRNQWPLGILRREGSSICLTHYASLLDDGRFAFWVARCWGDLRKLIDQAMQKKNNQGPPFPYEWNGHTMYVTNFIYIIAHHMDRLHKHGILHRDLKAANILLHVMPDNERIRPIVADFECSIGVVGTGFWRAPEILLALKNGCTIPFTDKMDVYSYGMICFELVTGRLPFEGELEACRASNNLIIEGHRPKLPSDLSESLKDVIERCWNSIPNQRPSFAEIKNLLGPEVILV